MRIKRDKLYGLMVQYCFGNFNRFARELGVDPSHLHRFLVHGIGGGKKLFGALLLFCKDKKLPFEDYIEIEVKKK